MTSKLFSPHTSRALYRLSTQKSVSLSNTWTIWSKVFYGLIQRAHDVATASTYKIVQSIKTFVLLAMAYYLTACKVAITVPENVDVSSQSGLINCSAGETCTFDVVDVYFDETFTATPHYGYEFSGWKTMHQGLCGGKVSSCHLYTTDFLGRPDLLAYLERDTVFHLEPEISVIEGNSAETASGELDPEEILEPMDYRHFFGVVWRGAARDNLRFASQMGYSHVAQHGSMRNLPEAEGLKFFMVNPEISASPLHHKVDTGKSYSAEKQAVYEEMLAWKDDGAEFPNNIATGWWYDSQNFLIVYDFQQQAVIDSLVDLILEKAKRLENPAINYTFAGLMWDVQDLKGDFWTPGAGGGGKFVDLSYWTGEDSCASSNHKHDYSTYSDGKAAFIKHLYQRTREEFQDPKFISTPFLIYDRWIKEVEARPDALELMPDMLTQEQSGTRFMDDDRIYASGLITRDRVGLTTPRTFEHQENLAYAATAAINGSWYNWFGKFGGDGNMPDYQNVYEVPARLQLIRMLPGWDNLNTVSLDLRSWNEEQYSSPSSYADANIIYSRHPVTSKIFTVFLNLDGRVNLSPNETVVSVMRTDGMFIESENGIDDIEYVNNQIRLISQEGQGKGYIITTRLL